ncbi:hypothetical protein GCM10017653_47930 [Ancylobacter defluvii]|uniref:Uncharacterized protein n=1 Tax=Ancylobacter defluvii TaxID=1282440 RepID=A0A9W6K498_9HYPH|nr:hypothetical protein [Ancylobacter defluvii]GLK86723.1 hypothetical protein GCM10017653_47930 [Ancylobacter defluvii]
MTHSVFWGSPAYTLIDDKMVGTVLILIFLPTIYAVWFRMQAREPMSVLHNAAPVASDPALAPGE